MSFISALYPPNKSVTTDPSTLLAAQAEQNLALQKRVLYGLVALGMFLRLYHFVYNQSFFIDELFLNVNLIRFDYWELATKPFYYEQKAPLGWLWVTKTVVHLFGKHEQPLRLFSLLCGLGGVILFVPVARYFLRGWAAVLAVGVLALGFPAIYHSVEAKQYSTELTATIVALYLFVRYKDDYRTASLIKWGLAGAILIWFSFSVVFTLAGIGIALGLTALRYQNRTRLGQLLIPGLLWGLSFALIYRFFLSRYVDSAWLTDTFRVYNNHYIPYQQPMQAVAWLLKKSYYFLSHPLGLTLNLGLGYPYVLLHILRLGWLFYPFLLWGTYAIFRHNKLYFMVWFLPLTFSIAASAVDAYPFGERFTLFLAPFIILALGYGVQQANERLIPAWRWALPALILAPCLGTSVWQAVNPYTFYNHNYYREALFFAKKHLRPTDAVYLYWGMQPAYEYYHEAYGLNLNAVFSSHVKNKSFSQANYLENLKPDFTRFGNAKRLWFFNDTNIRYPIGDFASRPAWYYDPAYPPGKVLDDYFTSRSRQVVDFNPLQYNVKLFTLRKPVLDK